MSITSFASGVFTGFMLPTFTRLGIGALVERVMPADVTIRIKCLAAVAIPASLSYFTISEDALFDTGYRIGISASAFIAGQAVGREVSLIVTGNTHLSNDRTLKEDVLKKLLEPVEAMMAVATVGLTYDWPVAGALSSSLIGIQFARKVTKAILNERQSIIEL